MVRVLHGEKMLLVIVAKVGRTTCEGRITSSGRIKGINSGPMTLTGSKHANGCVRNLTELFAGIHMQKKSQRSTAPERPALSQFN